MTRGILRRLDPNVPPVLFSPENVIKQKFDALGGHSFFGALDRKDAGRVWYFSNGCVCYNRDMLQAFELHGEIYRKWLLLGGESFGVPCSDELPTPDAVGRFNHFNDNSASIYWTPGTGAMAVYGEIRKKWASLGWEVSPLGYPMTDELSAPDGVGRFNHFSGGSIYWTPETGANAVWGEIRARWESLGWEQSYLGCPTSDEVDFPEDGKTNSFQHGGIYWWGDTGPIDLRGVIVHYTGLHCFGETDWDQGSPADEPYVIISVTTPQVAATMMSRIYGDVDAGDTIPDLIEIYRGPPYGINIGSVLMESDFGDPNTYKEDVQKVVSGVHAAGTVALGLIPIVGPVIAAVAGPALGTLMPAIGGAINNLLNLGDDRIGFANVTVPAKQMVLLAARTDNSDFDGLGFKLETPLISGSGASYKAYFGLIPA